MTSLNTIPTLIGGAAILAAAAIGLVQPAISHAVPEWDLGLYDSCLKAADDRFASGKTDVAQWAAENKLCCDISGGVWSLATCGAPPGTFETTPQTPHDVVAPLPTVATNAPATPAPGSRAPGSLPSGGVAP
jgi:hypothetical protein